MFSDHRPHDATEITFEDFNPTCWDLEPGPPRSVDDWWTLFQDLGSQAHKRGDSRTARMIWLLADACSLQLRPAHRNDPFHARTSTEFNMARDVGSFEAHVSLVASIYPVVKDPLLRARLADIAWLAGKPKNNMHAQAAMQAYFETPLDLDSWLMLGGEQCWRRGLMLAAQVHKKGQGDLYISSVADKLVAVCESELAPGNETNISLSVVGILIDFRLASTSYQSLARLLVDRSRQARAQGNLYHATSHLVLAKRLYRLLQDDEASSDTSVLISEIHIDEATKRVSSASPSFVSAVDWYNDARQELLTIPAPLRASRGVPAKLDALIKLHSEAQARSMEEFSIVQGPTLDLREEVDTAMAKVANKELLEALLAFSQVSHWTQFVQEREAAMASLEKYVGNSLYSMAHLTDVGRVVRKTPAFDARGGHSANDAAITRKMVEYHMIRMQVAAYGAIEPACHQLIHDHLIEEQDLLGICSFSSVVPSQRARLVAKGLKAGFEGDYDSALHLLVPQLEHMVRLQLKRKNVDTTFTEKNGVSMEHGLSTLVAKPEMASIFGPDRTFEISAVFCDQTGPNIRNDLAHGLLPPGAPSSYQGIYAWWMIFKLVFENYWYDPVKS